MNQNEGYLPLLTFSEKRKGILFLLEESPRSLSDIKDHFDVKSPEIQPQIKKMEAKNIITKNNGLYQLTPLGKVLTKYYQPFLDTITAIESNEDFWIDHNLSAIPENLLDRIKDLKECHVVKAENHMMFESHKEFQENVANSSNFRGVACTFIPSWIDLFLGIASKGAQIDIIITGEVFNKIKREYAPKLETLFTSKDVCMRVCDKLDTSFATTDDFFSLALNTNNGTYDHRNDLIGFDSSSIKWGDALFDHYKGMSVDIHSGASIGPCPQPTSI